MSQNVWVFLCVFFLSGGGGGGGGGGGDWIFFFSTFKRIMFSYLVV